MIQFLFNSLSGNAAHSLDATAIIIAITVMLLIASITAIMIKKIKLPFTVVLVIIGIILGFLSRTSFVTDNIDTHNIFLRIIVEILYFFKQLELSPEAILFIFLPTLVFESAYNLEAKKLIQNLFPILVLAIPVLLISTFLIGILLHLLIDLPLMYALLFGVLISATDPVAVIALFKELGAPKRLTVLMEGESLFNDGTAIVVFKIFKVIIIASVGVAAVGEAQTVGDTILNGIFDFLIVFLGGGITGIFLGWLFSRFIGFVKNNELIEITLSTILAYSAFIIAEHYLHVSGVMAVVTAGVTLGSYGKTKISPPVVEFMHQYWEYMAYIANCLIFLLVGGALSKAITEIGFDMDYLIAVIWALIAVISARGIGIYLVVPFLHKLKLSERVSKAYTFIMFWGGLRGAIALALALIVLNIDESVMPHHYKNLIFIITSMVVLFTLVVNATSIKSFIRLFKLDRLTPSELFLQKQTKNQIKEVMADEIMQFKKEGLFSDEVINKLDELSDNQLAEIKSEDIKLNHEEQEIVLIQQCIHLEKSILLKMFNQKRLSEMIYRKAINLLENEEEAISININRFKPRQIIDNPGFFEKLALKLGLTNERKKRIQLIQTQFGMARARYISSKYVLEEFLTDNEKSEFDNEVFDKVVEKYNIRHNEAQTMIDELTTAFPEYVERVQTLLAFTIQVNQETEFLEECTELGIINEKIKHSILHKIEQQHDELIGTPIKELIPDIKKLMDKIPLFSPLSDEIKEEISRLFVSSSFPKNLIIFKENERGDSMFVIARGSVKVIRDAEVVSTLSSGDVVGELSLLTGEPRSATIKTAVPSVLLELKREDLDALLNKNEDIKKTVNEIAQERLKHIKR